jgi:hypothetical protein
MNSTPKPNATESNDALVALADERLAHAYEQISRADEQLARVNQQLSQLDQDAARHPSVVPRRRPWRGRSSLRGLIGLLLAACIFAAAFVSQSSYGDAARLIIAGWAPQIVSTSSKPLEAPRLPAQPSPSTVQSAAAVSPPPQPITSAEAAPPDAVPTAAPMSPELTQLLQTLTRDLAHVEQGIEQLKASQEQMASDQAKVGEQLKASQEQMTRLLARASEQNPPPKVSTPLPRPVAAPARKPVPTLSPQARAHPRAPTQLRPGAQ